LSRTAVSLREVAEWHTPTTSRLWTPEARREGKTGVQVCVIGKIEDEAHFLLDCYVYQELRQKMLQRIKDGTGYDFIIMREDQNLLLDALIGHGLRRKEVRLKIGVAVASFIASAMRVRKQSLRPRQTE